MPKSQCPYCHVPLSGDEQMGVQCPACQRFFESHIRPEQPVRPRVAPTPSRASNAPARPPSRSGSGIGSAWWLIPLVLFGARACIRMGSHDRPRPSVDYTYDKPYRFHDGHFTQEHLRPPDIDTAEVRRRLEEILQERNGSGSIRFDPDSEEGESTPDIEVFHVPAWAPPSDAADEEP